MQTSVLGLKTTSALGFSFERLRCVVLRSFGRVDGNSLLFLHRIMPQLSRGHIPLNVLFLITIVTFFFFMGSHQSGM